MSTFLLRPPQFKSLREVVVDSLREAILDGSLRPGQRIQDSEVALQLGVSRTPVREALRQLEKDGLVRSTPNRGAIVNDLSKDDLEELYGIRAVLEGLAAARACSRITARELEDLQRLCEEMQAVVPFRSEEDRIAFLSRDMEFHELLVEASQSPSLAEMLSGIRMRIRMVMATISVLARASAQAAPEHKALLEAIRLRDRESAERLARQHVMDSMQRVMGLFHPTQS